MGAVGDAVGLFHDPKHKHQAWILVAGVAVVFLYTRTKAANTAAQQAAPTPPQIPPASSHPPGRLLVVQGAPAGSRDGQHQAASCPSVAVAGQDGFPTASYPSYTYHHPVCGTYRWEWGQGEQQGFWIRQGGA